MEQGSRATRGKRRLTGLGDTLELSRFLRHSIGIHANAVTKLDLTGATKLGARIGESWGLPRGVCLVGRVDLRAVKWKNGKKDERQSNESSVI